MTPTIIIDSNGRARTIYADETAPLMRALGDTTTRRASRVEPAGDTWSADMSPVGGPVLGPFDTRAEALNAEARWLDERNIPEVQK